MPVIRGGHNGIRVPNGWLFREGQPRRVGGDVWPREIDSAKGKEIEWTAWRVPLCPMDFPLNEGELSSFSSRQTTWKSDVQLSIGWRGTGFLAKEEQLKVV